jgi:hypothetical protein
MDQLELDLPGVRPLTEVERAQRWLAEHGQEESLDTVIASLVLVDASARKDRARRWLQVRAVQEAFYSPHGWLITGGPEALWLYEETVRCYVHGLYVAAIVCGHGACERATAGALDFADFSAKGWERWGLPPLAKAAVERDIISRRLYQELIRLSEVRKVTAHYKPPLEPHSVMRRALDQPTAASATEDELLGGILQEDALLAVRLATVLIRGQPGFRRVDLPENLLR